MSTSDRSEGRMAKHVEAGMECLDEGDLDGAIAALERARRIAKDHPDLLGLEIAVAEAQGDDDRALELCQRAAELSPEDPMPLLNAAAIHFHALGDHAAALRQIDQAFELIDEEDDLIAAVTLKADVLTDRGRDADLALARDTLAELSTSAIEDASVLIDVAELWVAAGAPDRARILCDQMLAGEEAKAEPALRADVLHLQARICDETGDLPGRTAAWLEVQKLDADQELPPWHLTAEDFEARARTALELLSSDAQRLLANVPIFVEPAPSAQDVRDGTDPRLLGLFQGVPLPEQAAVGGMPSLTSIHLYQHNLEHAVQSEDELDQQIAITVLHETAHFFGLDEDDLDERGLA